MQTKASVVSDFEPTFSNQSEKATVNQSGCQSMHEHASGPQLSCLSLQDQHRYTRMQMEGWAKCMESREKVRWEELRLHLQTVEFTNVVYNGNVFISH